MGTENTFLQQLIIEEQELLRTLSEVRSLITRYKGIASQQLVEGNKTGSSSRQPFKIPNNLQAGRRPYYTAMNKPPSEYLPSLTNIQKTVFGIYGKKEGDKFEIVDYLIEKGEKLDRESLVLMVGQHLSKLYREGLIDAEKVGSRHNYSLKA